MARKIIGILPNSFVHVLDLVSVCVCSSVCMQAGQLRFAPDSKRGADIHTAQLHGAEIFIKSPSLSFSCLDHFLPPHSQNTNITTLEVGPQNLVLQDNNQLTCNPQPFVVVPPGSYCTVNNPVDKRLINVVTL